MDIIEAGGQDADGDGMVDTLADDDGDSVPNSVDIDFTGGLDADNDGIDDIADADFVEGEDTDGDGIVDAFDPDLDGDGFANFSEDGDSETQFTSFPDANSNGTPDIEEAGEIIVEATPIAEPGTPEAALPDGAIRTGLRGTGCVINHGRAAQFDPLLMLLMLISMITLKRRATIRGSKGDAIL